MNREHIQKASSCLVPISVNLRKLDVQVDEGFEPDLHPGQELEAFFRFKTTRHQILKEPSEGDLLLKVYASSGVRLVKQGDENPANYLVEIVADFVATYALISETPPESVCLEEFGKHNTPLHIWPYWRELLNNMGDRFGFGKITLPMYRIREEKEESPKKQITKKKKVTHKN